MVRALTASSLAFLLVLSSSSPAQDVAPPDINDPGVLEKTIEKSIAKGVEWLKKQQKSDGCFTPTPNGPTYGGGGDAHPNKLGNTAIALLALLKSDVEPTDDVIKKGFNFMYTYLGQKANPRSTYEKAVTLMAIEALYEGMVLAKMRKKGEKPTERAGDFKEPKYTLSGNDAKMASELVKELVKDQSKKGGWRYGEGFAIVGSDEDISATQIMLLGLKSATRMKLAVDLRVFDKAMKFIMDSQEKDGPKVPRPTEGGGGSRDTYVSNGDDYARGWAYELVSENEHETRVTGAMTCAGIGGLLICKSALGKNLNKNGAAKVDKSIFDGFAWVSTHWTVTENPFSQRSHYYYLYGIERIGELGMFKKIGKHIWFTEGAKYLVQAQAGDGHWTDKEVAPEDLYATCFALLFLKKGTVPIGDVITGDGRYNTPSPAPQPQPQPSGSPEPEPEKE